METDSSSQLLRASGQSRRLQVTLEFPYCTSVQGAKVEVKSSVCDVEVSRLFNKIYNLKNRGYDCVNILVTSGITSLGFKRLQSEIFLLVAVI